MESLSGVRVFRTRLNSWVKGTEIELDLSLEDWPKLIYADGSDSIGEDGTEGQVKLVLAKGFSGRVDGVKLYVDRSWQEIGSPDRIGVSDGEEANRKEPDGGGDGASALSVAWLEGPGTYALG